MNKYDALKGKYASTTALRSKSGWSQFSIVEFFTKEARNEFLDLVKKDALTCHGQIAVARAQIPKYQEEADQPLRCAILVHSQIVGKHQRYKPTWELSAVWHEGEWILHTQAQENDKTRLTIYVAEALQQQFNDKFAKEWATWGAQKNSMGTQDFFPAQVEASQPPWPRSSMRSTTPSKNRNGRHRRVLGTHTPSRRPMMTRGFRPAGVRLPRPKGDGRGADTRQQEVADHHKQLQLWPQCFSTISIRGSYNSRRPVGEPGPPRGSFTTISYDHFLKPDSNYAHAPFHQPQRPQRIQRENRSNKRGLRSF